MAKFPLARWWLYVIEFPNGKRYFGVSRNIEKRFEQHLIGDTSRPPSQVHLALRAFPEAQIRPLVCGYRPYIFAIEAQCIEEFKTYRFENGYNIARGGVIKHLEWHAAKEESRRRCHAGSYVKWESDAPKTRAARRKYRKRLLEESMRLIA